MPFLQLSLDIGTADPAPFEDALFAIGALSVTLRDGADDPILEPAPGATPLWPTVIVQALFAADTDPRVLDRLSAMVGGRLPANEFELVQDRVWEREWLKDFHPMRFGQRLWVCPAGQRPSESDAVIVDLDPGLAFGTGTHATTALCLAWLDSAPVQDKRVIDYGCGSGILAIAALKLGAKGAFGTDIDPQALLATKENAERNGVEHLLTLVADPNDLKPADIVLANILAAPLQELAATLAELVTPGGHIVLSGLLESQAAAIAQRYRSWFDMTPVTCQDGWARLVGLRLAHD